MGLAQRQQRCLFACISFLHFLSLVFADSAANWTNPNGKLPAFSESYTVGEQIILSWLALNESRNDLWLTRYDTSTDHFAVRLEVSLDISVAGSYKWAIAIGAEDVEKDTRFMFQFLPSGMAYDPNMPTHLASPGVNLLIVNQQTPPNGTVIASSASSTMQTPTNTAESTFISSPTSTTIQDQSSQDSRTGLSSGAKAGIAIAVVVLIIGLALAAFILWKRRNRRTIDIANDNGEKVTGPYEMLADRRQPAELNPKDTMLYELNDSRSELSELPPTNSILKRPGLHELAS